MCRTRTSIPLCTACANAGIPRDSAKGGVVCVRIVAQLINPTLVNRKTDMQRKRDWSAREQLV
jgi:hypothetical protein